MKKKFICLFLALVMVLSLAMPALAAGEEIPASPAEAAVDVYEAPETPAEEEASPAQEPVDEPEAAAALSGWCGDSASWSVSGNTLTIYGYESTYDYPRNGSIRPPWQNIGTPIYTVIVKSGIVRLGAGSFAGMPITKVSLPNTLTIIDEDVFYGCRNLKSISVPQSVGRINSGAFASCPNLTSIMIYNKNCLFETNFLYDSPNAVVYGYPGSTAQNFTEYHGIPFKYLPGWYSENGSWYYYSSSGEMLTNAWVQDGGKWYWLGANGRMATGRQSIYGKYYIFNSSGVMQTGWAAYGGNWYYCGSDGAAVVNDWRKLGGKWYWFNKDGIMASNGRKYINGTWYCFDASGAMRTGWVADGAAWYYYTGSGAMATGWLKDGRTWYYLDPVTGAMVRNTTLTIGGKDYMFNASGAMYTGWISLGGGDYYYADGSGALLKNSWIKSGKYWYWLKADGLMARNETLTIGGVKYTFNDGGAWTNTGAGASSTTNEQYRAIVQNAASYFPGLEDDPYVTGYKYALVQMDPGDSTKTLLLAVEEGGLLNIYLYRYEPSTGKMLHPKDMLSTGVAPIGGFRGTLGMCADGYGLISTTWNGMNGLASIERVTMSGSSLRFDEVWTGRIDQAPDYGGREIVWHSTGDLSALS